jgi:hypothetical protein
MMCQAYRARAQHRPARRVPYRAKVAQHFGQDRSAVDARDVADVLQKDGARAQLRDGAGDRRPEVARVLPVALATGGADRLAREAGGHHVRTRYARPVDRAHVPVVRHTLEALLQHGHHGRLDLGVPDWLTERCQLQATVTTAQGSDRSHSRIIVEKSLGFQQVNA